jgi:hypothetical protein
MAQVVDTNSAKEFMKEALDLVAGEELLKICQELEVKSQWFREKLAPQSIPRLSSAEYFSLLRRVFATRRKAEAILKQFRLEDLRDWTWELLYGDGDANTRFQSFVDRFDGLEDNVRRDFASEILHFTDPDKYWLWTRWMWDPKTRTGALPLVTYDSYDFSGPTAGDIYMRVGEAVAFVHHVGEAAGFQTISRTIFGTDVFLSCVYVVYVYTVLRLRMTQEFNKVMPDLPEFSRRLLGVYRRPVVEEIRSAALQK